MADNVKSLFERLKPLWEAVEKLGEVDPEFDAKAFFDEMWAEEYEDSIASWEAGNTQKINDAELAEDVDTQFKMISAAYATGDAARIDRVIIKIATIRRMKKLGFYELRDRNDDGRDG
ncbi:MULTISPECIES: hypothetical protein [unclassified Ruegeria]|uniref:hypothetical protein n=1 Tax=unclassified Ruegeria TaxID=2625375 RepID=UPI001ADACB7C|nr:MULTISPECIES: hypothetical protein [unclassified Ruegeria]MBO9410765.1 hypothetical protein [Ruegeria sp. R8_1]MBO9414966.1 hypothetical protein [Ruegeria sp. R8_2]